MTPTPGMHPQNAGRETMDRMAITVDGMSCGHCVGRLARALEALEGVRVEEVKVGRATVAYDGAAASEERITRAIEDEGYAVTATAR